MTVIAWDGKTLAADRQGTNCGGKFAATKLFRLDDGTLLAGTGTLAAVLVMRDWYIAGADTSQYPECQKSSDDWARLVVVKPGGVVFYYEGLPVAIPSESVPAAWGSGRDFALGAMLAGADARRAVEITNMVSIDCGLGVDSAEPIAPGSTIGADHAQPYLNGSSIDMSAST